MLRFEYHSDPASTRGQVPPAVRSSGGAEFRTTLAALAGAGALARAGDPCGAATATAAANGARLTSCVVVGRDLRVTVAVTGPVWRGIETGELLAEARAGPG